MPFKPTQFEPTADSIKRYPEPDWTKPADVATIGFRDDPVGYLIVQGEALAWLSRVGRKDGWRFGCRSLVEVLIRGNRAQGLTARQSFNQILQNTPHLPMERLDLGPFAKQVREEWAKE